MIMKYILQGIEKTCIVSHIKYGFSNERLTVINPSNHPLRQIRSVDLTLKKRRKTSLRRRSRWQYLKQFENLIYLYVIYDYQTLFNETYNIISLRVDETLNDGSVYYYSKLYYNFSTFFSIVLLHVFF